LAATGTDSFAYRHGQTVYHKYLMTLKYATQDHQYPRQPPHQLVQPPIGAQDAQALAQIAHASQHEQASLREQFSWVEGLINGLAFMPAVLPPLWYITCRAPWVNWKTDGGIALVCGAGIAIAQGMAGGMVIEGILIHALALSLGCGLTLSSFRFILGNYSGRA
jgi:hypothetical protein